MGSEKARNKALVKLTNKIKIKPHIFKNFNTPVYTFLRLIFGQLFRSIFPANFTGLNNIPKKGPVIFASNHLSHVDPIFMIAGSRRKLHFLAKHEHFERFVTRFVVSSTGQIKTVREEGGGDALSTASGILDSGRCMGIFPEGTRSRNLQPPFLGKGKTWNSKISSILSQCFNYPCSLSGNKKFYAT